MQKVLIISLKFNPGHYSHLLATCRLVKESGLEPILFVNSAFNDMAADERYRTVNFHSHLPLSDDVKAAVFWFPSAQNIFEVIRLKRRYKARIIYIYHEPFESLASYVSAGFGLSKIVKICFVHLVNLVMLCMVNHVVLPSSRALEIYTAKYRRLNNNFSMVPLLFDDETVGSGIECDKRYISYIGTIAADHAFDKFLRFVESAVSKEWFGAYNFAIATSSVIPASEAGAVMRLQRSGRLLVSQGRPLNTGEINGFFNKSLVVWNAYNRSMQSGVLPKAYMFGAAVISARSSATENVDDHLTGRIVESNGDILEIREAVEDIIANREAYSKASRLKFMMTFYYINALDKFSALFS